MVLQVSGNRGIPRFCFHGLGAPCSDSFPLYHRALLPINTHENLYIGSLAQSRLEGDRSVHSLSFLVSTVWLEFPSFRKRPISVPSCVVRPNNSSCRVGVPDLDGLLPVQPLLNGRMALRSYTLKVPPRWSSMPLVLMSFSRLTSALSTFLLGSTRHVLSPCNERQAAVDFSHNLDHLRKVAVQLLRTHRSPLVL